MSFRFTMAAIDPTAAAKSTDEANGAPVPRVTLKIRHYPMDDESDDDDDDLADLLDDEADEDEEESDEDTAGPSNPAKARKGAASAKPRRALSKTADDEGKMDIDESNGVNGTSGRISKGKAKVVDLEEADDDDDDENEEQYEEFVVCTLDSTKVGANGDSSETQCANVPCSELPAAPRHHSA